VSFLEFLGFGRERDAQGRRRRGAWIQTYSGGKVWPLDPRAEDFAFDDWVVGVARECRYGRQCREFYSVAEHEVLVSIYAERVAGHLGWSFADRRLVARQALVHDHSEAITGDMPRPLKHQPAMRSFRKVEDRIQQAAFDFFGVQPTDETTRLVKHVENTLLMDEIEALMLDPQMFEERYGDRQGYGATIAAMPWEHAVEAWCQRYCQLWPEEAQRLRPAATLLAMQTDGQVH
jgi:5'-deoxynucleotidase YfbR-like HD superfamily hydrolase